ncbi:hypothetical protein DFP72DRAFT_805977 [Ephemerocybe angulata]|uniref:Uncharacterized protein n=1 Tax=Ephemerocybe angulata TaxID=980116 RepID=A0A8H6I6P2_9AGAR|nr:hypothetical protein DFP72DRAFT_805977 [Tulosesus angulatus]
MADYTYSYRSSAGLSYQDGPYPQASNLEPLHRSTTHNSSHHSHATSTHSWVQSNQHYPPPPPLDEYGVEDSMSPAVTPRPLPQHPQTYRPGTLYTVNAVTEPLDDEEEEYMNIDPNVSGQYEFQQPHNITVPNRRLFVRSPEPVNQPAPPTKQQSFVGGFVRGLRRLPKRMMGYGVSNEKGRLFRRGTFGTEASGTTAGMTTGNTLPVYRSNPPTPTAGPSGVQYVQDLQMAFAPNNPIPEVVLSHPPEEQAVPASLLPGGALRRITPSFRVTPPSESVSQESHAQIFQSPQPQYAQVVHPDPTGSPTNAERTTVMVYAESADHHGMPVPEPARNPARTPRVSGVPTRTPSVTIQTPMGHPPPPPPLPVLAPPPPIRDPAQVETDMGQSPATEHPLPTADYRKMSHFPGSPSRGTMFTRTTATSWYDPSYSTELTPMERFFKTLYNLPWVSHGRVTIDYRPGAGLEGKDKYKAMIKKPMSSWYKRFSRSSRNGNAELDLLSSGTMSIPDVTPRTSLGTSLLSSIPASPRSNRTGRRSANGHDSRPHKSGHSSGHRRHRHRNHRHRRRSMSTIEEPSGDRRTESPMLPAVYPYAYPPYPFTYPGYAAVPPNLPLTPGMPSGTKRGPRGPRHRSTRGQAAATNYPNGYAPYQAMAFPPPMYMAAQGSPTGSQGQGQAATPGVASGSAHLQQQQQQQTPHLIHYVPMSMPMQVVPGAYNPTPDYFNNSTTTSIPSPPSSPTPKAASAAPAT